MKRYLVFAGMILLGAVIYLYEEKPGVEPSESHIPATELTYAEMEVLHPATNSHFLDNINLSYEPLATPRDAASGPIRLASEPTATPASLKQLQAPAAAAENPVLTVADSKINFEVLGSEDFSLKFNLKPEYANPEALIPNHLAPGVGVSIKF